MAFARQAIKRAFWRAGWDIVRFNPSTHPLARRARLLRNYQIDVVLDVGANTGQYAKQIRDLGYKGQVISFEPLKSALGELREAARRDTNWLVREHACGATNGVQPLNVAANSQSSSFLPMRTRHVQIYPDSQYVGTEVVPVMRLDSIFDEVVRPDAKTWLKMDVQGFEMQVLEGAVGVLNRIDAIQAEVSLEPLYVGEATLGDIFGFMERSGFFLVGIEPYLSEPVTSHLVQVDCIFRGTECRRNM
jgi:FkbM family methyltransferase